MRNILVIDDSPLVRTQVSDALTEDGYCLGQAGSVQAALEAIALAPPDLILMDLRLPVIDGKQAIEQIRGGERSRHAPVIVLTDSDDDETIRELLAAGAVDFIPKPASAPAIRARVQCVARQMEVLERICVSVSQQRAVTRGSLDPLLTIDARGIIQSASDSVKRVFGWSWDELLGKSLSVLMPEPYRSEQVGYLRAYLRTGESKLLGTIREMEAVRRDGTTFPCTITANRIDVPGSGEPLFAGIVRDITEQKQAEDRLLEHMEELRRTKSRLEIATQKLNRTVEQLTESNQELEQFAYVASHDLQEPLRKVTSFCQLLKEEYGDQLDGDALTYIDYAVDGTARMRVLITDLLMFSRVGQRNKPLEPIDTNAACEEAMANLAAAIEDNDATVTHDGLPTVTADKTQLVQLFQNLIGNAIKYRGEDSPRVHVGAELLGDRWMFSVRDNGMGIDAEYYDRIFAIFRRLHGREEYSGTGIGLAVCKKIVERMGGKISVESEVGVGSTFKFTLPTKQSEPHEGIYEDEPISEDEPVSHVDFAQAH